MWTADEPQGKVLKHAFGCFTQKTGVKVNVQWFGRKVLTQNVAPALNTDTVPDLIDQDISQLAAAVVAAGTQSVEDVLALFDKSKKDGRAAIAQDGDINSYNAYFYTQPATRYVGAGGLEKAAKDRTGQSWKDNPDLLKAAQQVEKLAKGGYLINGWDAAKFPQVQNRWAEGEADYLFVGSWAPSETREYLNRRATADRVRRDGEGKARRGGQGVHGLHLQQTSC